MKRELRILTTSEVAKKLGVHPKTVSRLMRQGKVTGIKVANRWLMEKPAFETFSRKYVGKKGRPEGFKLRKGVIK